MKLFSRYFLVTLLVPAAIACSRPSTDPTPDPKPDPTPEYTGPVQGDSPWSVTGSFSEEAIKTNWDKDFVMAASGDLFVLKNLKVTAADEFKIRENKGWDNNRGGSFEKLGEGFVVSKDGDNIKPAYAGLVDVWYNPAKEQIALCEPDKTPTWKNVEPTTVKVNYTVSDEIFPNPERGFYSGSEVRSADGKGISKATMTAARNQGRSLFLLEFNLKDYVSSDISEDFLQTIRARFESLRTGGLKCILRFAYCFPSGGNEEELAPFKPWDAPLEQVQRHLDQLKPVLHEYADVILVVQAGFIGCWGEWYYTDNFKDNASRRALVDALLEAVPTDRQIELRTPGYKRNLFGFTYADTITRAEAHQPTPKARLGGHNDCYLTGPNDVGTYSTAKDRDYWGSESLYTIMGGESCAYDMNYDNGLTAYCHCEGTEKYNGALKDMAINHFTYLNISYFGNVITRWKNEGCLDEIKRRLGYRFILEEGEFTKKAEAGKPFEINLTLRNEGFSPAQNPRDVELVLCDASGKVLNTWPLDSDPRYWMPAQKTTINKTITIPDGVSGNLTLFLNLPDPYETLHNNPLFSIRLANEGTWKEETGYNQLYSFNL